MQQPRGFQALQKIQRAGPSAGAGEEKDGATESPRSGRGLGSPKRQKPRLELADRAGGARTGRDDSDDDRRRSPPRESPRAVRRQASERSDRSKGREDRTASERRSRGRDKSARRGLGRGSDDEDQEAPRSRRRGDKSGRSRRSSLRANKTHAVDSPESGSDGKKSDGDEDGGIRKGDRIELRQGRRFHPGVVRRVHSDGTFDVDLDNGDHDTRVALAFLRLEDGPQPAKKKKAKKRVQSDDEEEEDDDADRKSRGPLFFEGAEVEVRDAGRGVISRCLYEEFVFDVNMRSAAPMRRVPEGKLTLRSDLQPGDAVEVKGEGDGVGMRKYRGAVVEDTHSNNLLTVKYDADGEIEAKVSRARVRLLPALQRGDDVQALSESGVWLVGTITNARSNGTYDVRLTAAGDKMQRVPRSRLREPQVVATSDSFPLQAAVEMLVRDDDTHAIRYLAGSVAWAHADGCSYVIEADDGTHFDRVPRDHLRPPGGATGETPAASLGELSLFVIRLVPELLAYLLFAYGISIEVSQAIGVLGDTEGGVVDDLETALEVQGGDAWAQTCLLAHEDDPEWAVYNSTSGQRYAALDAESMSVPRDYLGLFVALQVLGLVVLLLFMLFYCRLKWRMLAEGRVDYRETALNVTTRSRMVHVWMGMLALSAFSVVAYSAMLVRLNYFCYWDGEYESEPFDANPFESRNEYDDLSDELESVMARVLFNICRGYFLLLVVEAGHSIEMRLFLVVPAVLATAVAAAKVVASIGVLHYVQRRSADDADGDFSLDTHVDLAVANVIFSLYLAAVLADMMFALKRHTDLKQRALRRGGEVPPETVRVAKMGEYGLLAQSEAREEEVERRERNSSMCGMVFSRQASWWVLHAGAAVSSFVAVIVLNDYVGGEDSESDAFEVDLGLAACWAVLHIAAPLARCACLPASGPGGGAGCCVPPTTTSPV